MGFSSIIFSTSGRTLKGYIYNFNNSSVLSLISLKYISSSMPVRYYFLNSLIYAV